MSMHSIEIEKVPAMTFRMGTVHPKVQKWPILINLIKLNYKDGILGYRKAAKRTL